MMKRWFKRKSKSEPKNVNQAPQHPPPVQQQKPVPPNDTSNAKEQNEEVQKKNQANREKTDQIDWKLGDAVSIFSISMKQYCPGVIVEINERKQEMTVRYWVVQNMELKYKIRGLLDFHGIKKREYATKYDPWNMPFDTATMPIAYSEIVRESLFKNHSELLSQLPLDTIDYNQRFVSFKLFLTESRTLCQKNPFIRLIGSYLGESVKSWIDIFVRFIFTMSIFEQESTNKKHFETKLNILFNILNVGSPNIDTGALNILCIMYSKCNLSKKSEENMQTKQQISEFAKRLSEKITAEDDEIDIEEFKSLIARNHEMKQIISAPVDQILSKKHAFLSYFF